MSYAFSVLPSHAKTKEDFGSGSLKFYFLSLDFNSPMWSNFKTNKLSVNFNFLASL